MSAPRTNLETQKRLHIGPLISMAVAVIFGVGIMLWWLTEEAAQGASPGSDISDSPEARPNDATNPPTPPASE